MQRRKKFSHPSVAAGFFAVGRACGHDSLTCSWPSTATSVGGVGSSGLVGLLEPISKGGAGVAVNQKHGNTNTVIKLKETGVLRMTIQPSHTTTRRATLLRASHPFHSWAGKS